MIILLYQNLLEIQNFEIQREAHGAQKPECTRST